MPHCLRCNRPLSNPDSVRHGYGPTCWAKIQKTLRLDDDQAPDPVTITDQEEAAKVRREIRRRLLKYAQVKTCHCGTPLEDCEFVTCDHGSGGVPLRGYAVPQWIWFECPKCGYQYAIWKLRGPSLLDLAPVPAKEVQATLRGSGEP